MSLVGALHFKYNGYDLPAGAARVNVHFHQPTTQFGKTGVVSEVWDVAGFVRGTTRDDLNTNMAAVETAFRAQGGDISLVDSMGTVTQHVLVSANTINGNNPVSFAWTSSNPPAGEYVLRRTFRLKVVGQVLPPDYTHDLIEFHESVVYIGTGGTKVLWKESLFGVPQAQNVKTATTVLCIQRGTAVGIQDWPAPTSPLYPSNLQVDLCHPAGYETPRTLGAIPTTYRTNWLWVMQGGVAVIDGTGRPDIPS